MEEGLTPVIGPHGCLLCPTCKGEYMHQTEVHVQQRVEEDGEMQITLCKDANHIEMRRDKTGAGRRDNLYVRFWCEGCMTSTETHKHHTLSIQQHKGVTYLRWI